MKTGKSIALIAALAVLPVLPYLLFGYAGQDFEFHVTSWMELRNAWLAGHLAPGWASHANFGLGDPHLVLYPPISFLIGGILSLLLTLQIAPAVYIWLALTLAGAAMYRASRLFVAEQDRLAAAILYMLSPYLVTTALVRFAAAELLVQAWLPFIFLYFYRSMWLKSRRATILLGVLLALSWLTNIPESLILLYSLLAVAGLCAWNQRSAAPLLRFIIAESIAGTLAAFYLLPLWFERRWINQVGLIRSDPRSLLLFMRRVSHGPETLKVFKYSCWLFAVAGFVLIVACVWKRCSASEGRTGKPHLALPCMRLILLPAPAFDPSVEVSAGAARRRISLPLPAVDGSRAASHPACARHFDQTAQACLRRSRADDVAAILPAPPPPDNRQHAATALRRIGPRLAGQGLPRHSRVPSRRPDRACCSREEGRPKTVRFADRRCNGIYGLVSGARRSGAAPDLWLSVLARD